ncbi:MAG: serine hydrolase domain-containing protein [Spirochaetota bacterium]
MNYRLIMKRIVVILFICIAITMFWHMVLNNTPLLNSPTITKDYLDSDYMQYLDQQVKYLMKKYKIPGANIAMIRQGKIAWVKAYGYADKEKAIPMRLETICRVESISKSVTAWGVMRLIYEGKISLDKPIENYFTTWKFPPAAFSSKSITVRHLLSHSAGLPLGTIGVRYSPDEKKPTLRESLYKDAVVISVPGTFSYSNTGFNILELLIEEVTKLSFADYMKHKILNPLGLKHSDYRWDDSFEPFPNGYTLNGKPIPAYVYPEKGAGGLFSTVEDIAQFVIAGMTSFNNNGNKIMSDEYIQKLYQPAVKIPGLYGMAFPWYGFGHFIEISKHNIKAVSHGGQGTGWMTHFHSIPQTGDGIVILTNSQRSWPFFAYILNDWAQWIGFGSVGMSKIIYAELVLWFVLYILLILILLLLYRLINGLLLGIRKIAFFKEQYSVIRIIQLVTGIIVLSILLWAVHQDYLFISSVFPEASVWGGYCLALCGFVLLLYFFIPEKNKITKKIFS